MQRIYKVIYATCFGLIAAVMLFTCVKPAHAQLGRPVAATCPETQDAHYFPVGTFAAARYEGADLDFRQWYSNQLAAMAEPSLSCGELDGDEVYRFLALAHFWSISVRISRHGDVYSLKSVMMNPDDASRGQPGPAADRITKVLTPAQNKAVLDRLESIKFWQLETLWVSAGYLGVRDGSEWILEARRGGRYHVVNRGTGDTVLPTVGQLFFDLAGIDTEPDEFDGDSTGGIGGMVLPF